MNTSPDELHEEIQRQAARGLRLVQVIPTYTFFSRSNESSVMFKEECTLLILEKIHG